MGRSGTCRRVHRVHGRCVNSLEQETLACLQFAQACSLVKSSAAGWISEGVVGGATPRPTQGPSWHVDTRMEPELYQAIRSPRSPSRRLPLRRLQRARARRARWPRPFGSADAAWRHERAWGQRGTTERHRKPGGAKFGINHLASTAHNTTIRTRGTHKYHTDTTLRPPPTQLAASRPTQTGLGRRSIKSAPLAA